MPVFGPHPGEPDPGQSMIDWIVAAPPAELAPELVGPWRPFSCWSMPNGLHAGSASRIEPAS